MTENKQNKPISQSDIKDMQDSYEEALAKKEETIQQLRRDLVDSGKIKAKAETEIDSLKTEKQVALEKAERAEARYLRNTELENKGKQQETNLLNKLFD